MVNSRLSAAQWYKRNNADDEAGALLVDHFDTPKELHIAIKQRSEVWIKENVDRSESTHRAITYQKGIQVGDKIVQNNETFIVEYTNDDARLAILGLIKLDLN